MITVESVPYLGLSIVGIGFGVVIVALVILAHQYSEEMKAERELHEQNSVKEMGELFSYFLEEEEKKNQELRQTVKAKQQTVQPTKQAVQQKQQVAKAAPLSSENMNQVQEIAKCYDEGKSAEEIAKQLGIGVGEVNLILSMYTMR